MSKQDHLQGSIPQQNDEDEGFCNLRERQSDDSDSWEFEEIDSYYLNDNNYTQNNIQSNCNKQSDKWLCGQCYFSNS